MIVKQETKHKGNETKRDTTETKRNNNNKSSMNKKTKQTLTKRFFYMRQQSTKCQWWIEKPLKFTGRFGYGRKK
jgi:hypothetical protein